jgi:hypothetical protein
MVCSSTFLIDNTTNYSSKLEELDHILTGKLDIGGSNRKVVLLTEWKRMLNIIAKMLEHNHVNFVEITEDTGEKNKQLFLKQFEEDDQCKIMLTTENTADKSNLKIADTLINFDTPVSNAQKNHRLEIIDPIRRGMAKLTIINLIAENSIETWSLQEADFLRSHLDQFVSPNDSNPNFEIPLKSREILKKTLIDLAEKLKAKATDKTFAGRPKKKLGQMELDFSDEESDPLLVQDDENTAPAQAQETIDQKELKNALKSGVDFLTQLVKISTGKSIGLKANNIDVDKEAGEIVLRFKISDKEKNQEG